MEFPRVVAALAAFVGDLGLAEELAQDALVDALRQWPRDGIPRQPGAWLTTVGKRKAVDLFRRNSALSRKYAQLGRELELAVSGPGDEDGDELVRPRVGGGHRRRPPAAHVRGLPPGPVAARPHRPHVASRRRPHRGRDRPRLRRPRADDRPAHRARQEDDRLGRRSLRGARPARTGSPAWSRCSRSSTSSTTRGTRPPRATTGCGPSSAPRRSGWGGSWPAWHRRNPRSTAWSP